MLLQALFAHLPFAFRACRCKLRNLRAISGREIPWHPSRYAAFFLVTWVKTMVTSWGLHRDELASHSGGGGGSGSGGGWVGNTAVPTSCKAWPLTWPPRDFSSKIRGGNQTKLWSYTGLDSRACVFKVVWSRWVDKYLCICWVRWTNHLLCLISKYTIGIQIGLKQTGHFVRRDWRPNTSTVSNHILAWLIGIYISCDEDICCLWRLDCLLKVVTNGSFWADLCFVGTKNWHQFTGR